MLKNQVSFPDGAAEIYTVENVAEKGDKPAEKLTHKRTVRFKYKTVGERRFYDAQQAGVTIERMLIIPRGVLITPQSVVIITSEGDQQYRVKQVQLLTEAAPISVQISLERIEQAYEIAGV